MHNGLFGLRAVVSLFAVMALTGAKTNGCGPDLGTECPEGSEFDGENCVIIVDPICPDGFVEETVCEGFDGDFPGPITQEAECWTQCVPIDPNVCPPGFVEQTVCEGWAEPADGVDPSFPEPPPDQNCWSECVPESQCPPGFHEEWICDEGCDPSDPTGCALTCVPDDVCPPNSYLDVVCDEYGCYETCIPVDLCPPGTHLDFVCDEYGCYETCTPDDVCPPGTIGQTTCWDDGMMGGGCSFECVPVELCPDGTIPQLVCAGGMTDPYDPSMPAPPEQCWYECFAADPTCPDGSQTVQTCDENGCIVECLAPR